MSQLVSARLLIGAGRFRTSLPVDRTFRRHFSTARSWEQSFFAPSFDMRNAASAGNTQSPLIKPFWTHSRSSQQALTAASSYAPPSDDPSITSRRRIAILSDLSEESAIPIPSTHTAAINAGYRPILQLDLTTLPKIYRQLAKGQLTFLVTLTAMAGYALCPAALATTTSVTTLLALTSGTALCSASANSINQLVESPYDAQMPRTRNRPMPTRSVTPLHAATFATICGTAGVGALAAINPLTAILGLSNIILYAGMYTPLKRISISNTWLGSLVGALPPLMGWAACTGSLNLITDMPAWTLAALLFAWQFPHFNSLSHSLSKEYARGGYKMMSVTNPDLNKRTSLRYAIALLPICSIWLPWTGLVHWTYAVLSAPINAGMIYAAYGFWRRKGDKEARFCFWVSLVHLPAILLLAMVCKADVVDGLLRLLGGEGTANADAEEDQQ
jgi:protoheme IX farnesyltransferase